MKSPLKRIRLSLVCERPFLLFDREWMLITAGTFDSFNTMTASWGALGTLWSRPVAFGFIRPTRHTFGFANRSPVFTCSFFGRRYRAALEFCGTKSGRDVDKVKATGLTPVKGKAGCVYFAEARLVLECRTIHAQDIDPRRFLDPTIEKNYPKKDYHRMFIGEVIGCLRRD